MSPQRSFFQLTFKYKAIANINKTMRFKLFALLSVLVFTMVIGVAAILMTTGLLTAGREEAERFIASELSDIHHDLDTELGTASARITARHALS